MPIIFKKKTNFRITSVTRTVVVGEKGETEKLICARESNTVPYVLFCISSILSVYIDRVIESPVSITFSRRYADSDALYLQVISPKDIVLQAKTLKIVRETVDNVLSDIEKTNKPYCMLFRSDLKVEIDEISVPVSWLRDMLRFIYNKIFSKRQDFEYRLNDYGDLFVYLDKVDFLTEYDNIQREIMFHMKRYFRKGTLFNIPEGFDEKWMLKKYSGCYIAQWYDKRVFNEDSGENMTMFLIKRLKKDYFFLENIKLQSPYFKTEIVKNGTKVYVSDLKELWSFLGHIRHVWKNEI
jgi:hypothetical protein